MRKITLAEATLSNCPDMSFKEKMETARLLDMVNTDIIETCPLSDSRSDELLVKNVAAQTGTSVVSCPVTDGNTERAWNAIREAAHPRLNVKFPVSVVQMEYTAHRKAPKMLEWIEQTVKNAKDLCEDVEFTALDATRAEADFLADVIRAAVSAGASTITLSDDEGTLLPSEFGEFVKSVKESGAVPENVTLGVVASDRMSMAEASAFEAVKAGADLVYVRAAGKNMPDYRIFVEILAARGERYAVGCDADMTALTHSMDIIKKFAKSRQVEALNSDERAPVFVPAQVLDADSDIKTVADSAVRLGYDLKSGDLAKVYEHFRAIAAKKTVDIRELDAIIASVAQQVPPTYTLSSFVVNSGNVITATANVALEKNGERLQGLSAGDGPIDAALMAIEKIVGHHYELDDFSIQAVTSGREAVGEALVRLRDGGKLYSGRGISTDIVGAAIRAYLNALNKIVYKGSVEV